MDYLNLAVYVVIGGLLLWLVIKIFATPIKWAFKLLLNAALGFIMLFVWGFGGNVNTSKKNWARAALIWMAISVGLVLLFWLVFGMSLRSSYYYY